MRTATGQGLIEALVCHVYSVAVVYGHGEPDRRERMRIGRSAVHGEVTSSREAGLLWYGDCRRYLAHLRAMVHLFVAFPVFVPPFLTLLLRFAAGCMDAWGKGWLFICFFSFFIMLDPFSVQPLV